MAEETASSSSNESKNSLDLNTLSGLDFGPNWADEKSAKSSKSKRFDNGGSDRGKGSGSGRAKSPSSRDRRSGGRPQRSRDDQRSAGSEKRGRGRPDQSRAKPTFTPTVKVDIYPQDEAFEALVKRLQTSARTYQLFEIAHLLLEKPERYVVVVAPKDSKPNSSEAKPLLYYSVPGHLPFASELEAIDFVVKEHIDQFFEVEEIEVEPPSGNFQMVNRCSITGELLGPPNYHRYQEFLQRHYNARINGMSFERFQSKVESSKEQEDIDAWLESMKKGARYVVKDRQDSEPESFDTLEAARHFLISQRKDKVVCSGDHVRFAGRDIERIPMSDIRRSVESYIEEQKHFPLDSANNIRGRLRRHKFAVYKKGSKGVSFVCAVKRKFRDSKTVFTESISDLIDFIEKHPEIPASKLSKEYIGIDTEKQQPSALEMKEEEAATTASAVEPETSENTDIKTDNEAPQAVTAESTPAPDKEASTQATPKVELSEDEHKKLKQLMLDLRWLITEGYVTEYGDGRLFAPAPLPESTKKDVAPAKKTVTADIKSTAPDQEVAKSVEAEVKREDAKEPPAEASAAAKPDAENDPPPEVSPSPEKTDV